MIEHLSWMGKTEVRRWTRQQRKGTGNVTTFLNSAYVVTDTCQRRTIKSVLELYLLFF